MGRIREHCSSRELFRKSRRTRGKYGHFSGMETLPHEVKNHRPNFIREVIRSCKSKYNTVAKRKIKRQTMADTALHRKLNIDQYDG